MINIVRKEHTITKKKKKKKKATKNGQMKWQDHCLCTIHAASNLQPPEHFWNGYRKEQVVN